MKKLFNLSLVLLLSTLLVSCGSNNIEVHNLLINELKDQSAVQIYEKAEKEFQLGNYKRAMGTYEALNSLYPFSAHSADALFRLVQCHYQEAQMEDTIKAADKFILLYPKHPHIENVWYLKTKAYFHQTHHWILRRIKADMSHRDISGLPHAEQSCRDLLAQFPNTMYREKVEKRLKKIHYMLADYEYHIVDYYFKKKAYLAALNRGSTLCEKYADTPAAERVKSLIQESKIRLGLEQREN
jgi:outer membrane protein assembly factor BamD